MLLRIFLHRTLHTDFEEKQCYLGAPVFTGPAMLLSSFHIAYKCYDNVTSSNADIPLE